MKCVTLAEFSEVLKNIKGATFVTLATETDARLKKTGNPFGKVLKRNTVNGVFNFNYENSVNRQLAREGQAADFEAQGRTWGQHETLGVISKGEQEYVQIKVEKAGRHPRFVVEATGKLVSKDEIKPWLPAKSPFVQGGQDKEVIIRDYKLDSVRAARIKGQTYIVGK